MNEIRCWMCSRLLSKVKGDFKVVIDDYDVEIQCPKCKAKTSIKLERLKKSMTTQ